MRRNEPVDERSCRATAASGHPGRKRLDDALVGCQEHAMQTDARGLATARGFVAHHRRCVIGERKFDLAANETFQAAGQSFPVPDGQLQLHNFPQNRTAPKPRPRCGVLNLLITPSCVNG